MPSTRPYRPRIVFVFDFDKTLASDSVDALLATIDLDRQTWRDAYLAPLGEGWDPILQRDVALLGAMRDRGRPLDEDVFKEAAERLNLYPGVLEMPDRVRAEVAGIHANAACEFAVLSSGFRELIDKTSIAETFDSVWAGRFHFADGEAVCTKRVITHPQKALYLRAYAEGLSVTQVNTPGTSSELTDEHDMHVLFDQMVYVGDGESDLQAFGFLEGRGGTTIAIEDEGAFDAAADQTAGQRVANLAPSDYREGSELLQSLKLAAQGCAARVALRAWGRGE